MKNNKEDGSQEGNIMDIHDNNEAFIHSKF